MRLAGQMLQQTELNEGATVPGTNRGTTQSQDVTTSPKLLDFGLTKTSNLSVIFGQIVGK